MDFAELRYDLDARIILTPPGPERAALEAAGVTTDAAAHMERLLDAMAERMGWVVHQRGAEGFYDA